MVDMTRRETSVTSFVVRLAAACAVAVLGVAAILYADADDAPGLGMIGLVLIAGAIAVAVRTVYRRSRHASGPDTR